MTTQPDVQRNPPSTDRPRSRVWLKLSPPTTGSLSEPHGCEVRCRNHFSEDDLDTPSRITLTKRHLEQVDFDNIYIYIFLYLFIFIYLQCACVYIYLYLYIYIMHKKMFRCFFIHKPSYWVSPLLVTSQNLPPSTFRALPSWISDQREHLLLGGVGQIPSPSLPKGWEKG